MDEGRRKRRPTTPFSCVNVMTAIQRWKEEELPTDPTSPRPGEARRTILPPPMDGGDERSGVRPAVRRDAELGDPTLDWLDDELGRELVLDEDGPRTDPFLDDMESEPATIPCPRESA
jgi:hypothetical protein